MPDEPPKHPPFTRDFRLGEWLVQPSLDHLSRGGVQIHLRPQLTNLLVVLARHAGRTVSKDVILQEVWATQYVGESVLTRCMTEIRQALGDDARAPKVIETISKRGYRLVAPVVFLDEFPAGGNGGGLSGVEAPAAGDPTVRPGPPDGTPGQEPAEPKTAAAPEARRLTRRTAGTALKVAVVVGVAVTVGAGDWSRPVLVSERDTVLLADIANTTGNRVFDDALRLALAVNLEQAPFLRVQPQAATRAALSRMGRSPDEPVVGALALDVCRREGAAVLLAGSIAPLGSRFAVGLEAVACGSGESLGRAIDVARDREEVLSVLERVATRIRAKLGESRTSMRQHSIPLARATTASLEALQALTLGDENRDHARLDEAVGFYRQATEIDPGFALAWARLGAITLTLDLPDESASAFRRAYELRDKVSQAERFYIEGHYFRFVVPDPQKAIESYRAWKRMYPGSIIPPNNLASILARVMGQYDAALVEAREAVRLGPFSSLAYGNLIVACLGSGRLVEAREAIAEATRLGITDRVLHGQMLDLALFDGDRGAIDREIRWASGDPIAALSALQLRASAAMAAGRLLEGRRLWAEAVERAGEIGPARRVAEVRLGWAESEALVGDARRARAAAESAVTGESGANALVEAALVIALTGDSARARSILDEVPGRAARDPIAVLAGEPVVRALVESNLGQGLRSIATLQSVVRFENGTEFGPAPLVVRGLALRAAGRPAEAAAAFDAAIGRRVLYPSSAWLPFARVALARALRESGDAGRSLATYDAFLDSWKDADPDAPLLATARRERAVIGPR